MAHSFATRINALRMSAEVDGESYTVELERNGSMARYALHGAVESSGTATITELLPGVFSVLVGNQSIEVRLEREGDGFQVWTNGTPRAVSIADPRERSGTSTRAGAAGPVELRAQMPGKVINLLVQLGATVQAGQGLMVVEAMKMQNEMKSPKDGIVSKIHAIEGATVAAGDALLVVE